VIVNWPNIVPSRRNVMPTVTADPALPAGARQQRVSIGKSSRSVFAGAAPAARAFAIARKE